MNSENKKENADHCPKVAHLDKKIARLPYNDRLQIIEKEANSLYNFCLRKGFSNVELQTCISKFRGPPKSTSRKALDDSIRSFFYLSVVIAMVAVFYQSSYFYNILVVHAKLGMIKYVLPYWDWASLYQGECMINNVFLPVPNMTFNSDTCFYCINMAKHGNNTVDRLNNTSGEEITKFYIEKFQPVVITDTNKMWIGTPQLTMDVLAKLYQTDPLLSTVMGSCMYSTNVGFNETFYDFITAYVNKKLPDKWHIIWQNCESNAAKVLRRYYVRPYFLPGMAQAGIENTVIAAKGQHLNEDFNVILTTGKSGHWISVASGSLNLRLTPHKPCLEKYGCAVAEVTLDAGQSVFFNDEVWFASYTVTSDEMTIALASSVIWDEM